jgi:hypothetical protein
VLRAYEAGDLLGKVVIPNSYSGPGPIPEERTREELREEISVFLVETVEPESWIENNGDIGRCGWVGSRLVVFQTPENQVRTQSLLAELRETSVNP